MSEHERFWAPTEAGVLGGLTAGEVGPPVLLLHGGPGLGHEYLDPVVAELRTDFRVATFQQRGLEPSTLEGPFTIAQALDDIVSVLDALGSQRALVIGHSWGAHLALRFTAAHQDRLLGMLAIEPIGVVGDGGRGSFEMELLARVPADRRKRLDELSAREEAGEATLEETLEAMAITWPFFSPTPLLRRRCERNGHRPRRSLSSLRRWRVTMIGLPPRCPPRRCATASLSVGRARSHGAKRAGASADLSPHSVLRVVPDAGHFVWLEAPGRVRVAALELLDRQSDSQHHPRD